MLIGTILYFAGFMVFVIGVKVALGARKDNDPLTEERLHYYCNRSHQ